MYVYKVYEEEEEEFIYLEIHTKCQGTNSINSKKDRKRAFQLA